MPVHSQLADLTFGEDAVHRFRAVQHDGPYLVPVDGFSGRLVLMTDQIGGKQSPPTAVDASEH